MHRVLALVLLLATAAVGVGRGTEARAAERDTLFCGTLTAHERSSAERTGSVTVGGTTIVLAAEPLYSTHPGTQERLRVGTAICFSASYNAGGEAVQYLVNAMPDPICAKVVAIERPTAMLSGAIRLDWLGVGTFAIPAGTDIGPDRYPAQPCFRLALDPAGRAQVVGRVLTVADRTAALLNVCGLVAEWTAPARQSAGLLRHETPGSIRIGSRTYAIVAGTEYSTVNASPVVGRPTCMSASLDAQGRVIQYGAQPGMPDRFASLSSPEEYVAPTSSLDGLVRFRVGDGPQAPESYRFRIPAGTALPADARDAAYCWDLSLDAGGDAVVTGARTCPSAQGVATAPGAGPAVAALPSTSTSR